MTKRRTPTRRNDRQTEPFCPVPDAFYQVLEHLSPWETKLWLALRLRAWRKGGARKGVIRKTLNRVANDIGMARSSAQKAFRGLREKGLAEWNGHGVRLTELDFTTAFTTAFTMKVQKRTDGESGHVVAGGGHQITRKWPRGGRQGDLVPFPSNRLDHGREDLIDGTRGAPKRARAYVDRSSPKQTSTTEDRAPLTPSGDGARPHAKRKEKDDVSNNDDDLTVREMPRDAAIELLRKIKARALAAADEGTAKLKVERDARREKEEQRKAELRQQARDIIDELDESVEKGEETT